MAEIGFFVAEPQLIHRVGSFRQSTATSNDEATVAESGFQMPGETSSLA